MALLRAFQLTAATKYRDGARRIATFLRRAQCVGLYTNNYARSNPSDARWAPAPFPTEVVWNFDSSASVAVSGFTFLPSGIICAWALNLLRQIDGDATYGDATAVGDFVARTDATLTSAIRACIDWWEAGAVGESDGSQVNVVGLGAATPRSLYLVFQNGAPALTFNEWIVENGDLGLFVYGFEYAAAIRALYEVDGFSDKVTELYSWVRSFTAAALNAPSASADADAIIRSLDGVYDPNLCLARALRSVARAEAGVHNSNQDDEDYGPFYDWRTVGLLAPLQSARDAAAFGVAKDTMSRRRARRFSMRRGTGPYGADARGVNTQETDNAEYVPTNVIDDLRLLTYSGLSLQTSIGVPHPDYDWTAGTAPFAHLVDLEGAAICGDAYRYEPMAMPLEQG